PGHLVAERTTDPRLGGVADVVEVEQQKRAAFTRFQRRLRATEPVVTEPGEVDAFFVVDTHVPRGRERTRLTHPRRSPARRRQRRFRRPARHLSAWPVPEATWRSPHWCGPLRSPRTPSRRPTRRRASELRVAARLPVPGQNPCAARHS